MSDQLNPQAQNNIDELVADVFTFEAATRGPESAFCKGDRVTPAFAASVEMGRVVETASATWAKQNLYPYNPDSAAASKWDTGAVKVRWDSLGTVWWPSEALSRVTR